MTEVYKYTNATDLKQIDEIANTWDIVYDVASIDDNILIVATGNGLFHATLNGQQICTIATGSHDSAVVFNRKLYATAYNSGKICICTYNGTWKSEGSIPLPCKGYFTLCVTANSIMAYEYAGNKKLYKLSHTGQVLQTFGSSIKGTPGYAFLCQTGADEAVILADERNDKLMILDKNDWSIVRLEPFVERPRGAVYAWGKLYIVSQSNKALYEYTVQEQE